MGWNGPFIFRFTGRVNWRRMYRDSRAFWVRRTAAPYGFIEKQYIHKPSKLHIKWEITHNYDAYYQIAYKIEFRFVEPKTVNVTENGQQVECIEGAMYCWAWYTFVEDWKNPTPAGSTKVFQHEWLKAIYRKVTWRDRWDLVDDIGMFTCNDFIEFLKKETQMEARSYGSIWESG